MQVIGYGRVSTDSQAENGHSLDYQQTVITAECHRRGWPMMWLCDTSTGKNTNRAGLQAALLTLKAGGAKVLMVAKLDRLSRSVHDFAGLCERARREGWAIIALDIGIDTTTPQGELVAGIMVQLAQWEARIISQRTKEGLSAARSKGIQLGARERTTSATKALVRAYSEQGLGVRAIASRLNAEGVPSASGGRWHPTQVARVLARLRAE